MSGMPAGGLGLIGFILLIGGGICHAMGFYGLGNVYGGTNGMGGLFTLLMGIMPLVLLLVTIIFASAASGGVSEGGARAVGGVALIMMIVFFVAMAMSGILGGLGVMGAKAALGKPAGILLLVGGVGSLLMILATLGVLPLSLVQIVSYVWLGGFAAGYLLAGLTMFAERG